MIIIKNISTTCRFVRCGLMMAMLTASSTILAAPYTPGSDDDVIEILPSSRYKQESNLIQNLKSKFSIEPNNSNLAYQLATAYVNLASNSEDPRYYGLAERILQPWWNIRNDRQILLLKAKILQYNHQFSQAIVTLNRVLTNSPYDVNALLTRANLHQVMGRYADVKKDCQQLTLRVSSLISLTCFASVSGFTQNRPLALQLVDDVEYLLDNAGNESIGVQLWVIGLLAEIASLMGDFEHAEALLRSGLTIKHDATYLLSLYADLLLKQGKYEDCRSLLAFYDKQTALLVRLLAAESQLNTRNKDYAKHQLSMDLRIAEDKIKNDTRHLREYAYYTYYVKRDYPTALQQAVINWQNQREMSDALLLYRTAAKLNNQAVLDQLAAWIQKNNIQVNFSEQSLSL